MQTTFQAMFQLVQNSQQKGQKHKANSFLSAVRALKANGHVTATEAKALSSLTMAKFKG